MNWIKLLSVLQRAEKVLQRIQEFDPLGVASRSLEECLLVQIRFLYDERDLLEKMVRFHLSDLERKKYQAIASALNARMEEVVETAKVIAHLEPKPGRPFSDQEIVEILKKQGLTIARRTIAKYREMLGILPSSRRKKFY